MPLWASTLVSSMLRCVCTLPPPEPPPGAPLRPRGASLRRAAGIALGGALHFVSRGLQPALVVARLDGALASLSWCASSFVLSPSRRRLRRRSRWLLVHW